LWFEVRAVFLLVFVLPVAVALLFAASLFAWLFTFSLYLLQNQPGNIQEITRIKHER
jgi:hypothetical protein